MAKVTNTFLTYDAKGIREDLTDIIYNISPEETPVMTAIGSGGKAKQTYHEWQVDELATPSTSNQQVEGDDVTTYDAVSPTTRIGNYMNISRKTVIIADTEEEVDKAGRDSELAYQLAKKSAELKRDMESAILDNIAADAGGAANVARVTGSFLAFIKSNTNHVGTDPVYTTVPNDVRTDGTQRTFLESHLTDVISQVWTEGGTLKYLFVGAFNKAKVSAFAGIATKTLNINAAKPTSIIGAADVYVSDFGNLTVMPNRFQRGRDALLIDPAFASLVFLRKFRQTKLAKTGDAEKRMILAEWGLKVNNEKAHGGVFDLTTS